MLITNVRAHHVRIPYDAGVASFKQGASAIAALDIVVVEVSTDAGLTGWGDAFAYVSPQTTAMAIDEMIAPQARGLDAPDAAEIPAFMERIQRNLHLFGPTASRCSRSPASTSRYGILPRAQRASRCIVCSERANARGFR